MAITGHKLLKSGGSASAKGEDSSNVDHAYEVMYQLTSNDPLDGPKVAEDYFQNTNGLPWIGDPYQFGNDQRGNAICKSVDPVRVAGSDIFNVTVRYETAGGGGGGQEPEKVSITLQKTNPLFWHDQLEIGSTQISVPITTAKFRGYSVPGITNPGLAIGYEGPVINSALDAFDPAPEFEDDIEVLRITRNVFPYDDVLASGFRGTVNNAAVTIHKPDYGFTKDIPAFCGRIHQFSARFMVDLEYRVKYYELTIEVHIRKDSWRLIVPDKGLRRRAAVGDTTETGITISASNLDLNRPQLVAIRDPSGNPITTPVLLNGRGRPLMPSSPTSGLPPHPMLFWEVYDEIPWNTIPW